MRVMKFISVGVIVVMISVVMISAVAVAQVPAENAPVVKHVPITNVPSNSGKEMYSSYCAVCHGKTAKGDGPAATAMKVPPTDLTTLAQKSGGKYPAAHVASVIRGQAPLASHGSQDMPIWGRLFSSISQGHEAQVHQRVANLVEYIETLQAK